MRIYGPNGPAAPSAAPATRRSANSPFALPQDQAQPTPAGSAGVRTVGGIDALIALQGIESAVGAARSSAAPPRSTRSMN